MNHRILAYLPDKWLACCRLDTACLDRDISLLNCECIPLHFSLTKLKLCRWKIYLKLYNLCRYAIMTECWEEQPTKRPTFHWLCSAVRRLLDDHKVCKVSITLWNYSTHIRNGHPLFQPSQFVRLLSSVYKPLLWRSKGWGKNKNGISTMTKSS